MAAPSLRWYDSAGVALTSLTFTGLAPGVVTAATEVQVWNNKGGAGADDGRNIRVKALERDPGETAWNAAGRPYVDNRYIELRVLGPLNGAPAFSTGWTPLGSGVTLPIPDLANDKGYKCELRLAIGAEAGNNDVEIALRAVNDQREAVSSGLSESTADGILMGLGDGSWSQHLSGAAAVENPAGVNDQVQVGDQVWVGLGEPRIKLKHLVQLNNLDSAAAALASGEAYLALLTLAVDGTIRVTKGVKATSPTEPAFPTNTGELPYALVKREFDGLINNADITDRRVLSGFGFSGSAGLTVTLYRGRARVDNSLAYVGASLSATLTASTTSYLWLTAAGTVLVTTTSYPSRRAVPLLKAVTDATTVTSTTDLRRWVGAGEHRIAFRFDATLAATQEQYASVPWPSGFRLRPREGVVLAVDTVGSGTGASTFDVEVSDAGGAFTTIFTSQGTEDRRPSVAGGASEPVGRAALPEVTKIPGFARVRAVCDAIPATTAPDGATLYLIGDVA